MIYTSPPRPPFPPEGIPRPGTPRERVRSKAIQPLPPEPERKVTMAVEWPENFVRPGGEGATSLIGRKGECVDEKERFKTA